MESQFNIRFTTFMEKAKKLASQSKGFPEPEQKELLATLTKKKGQIEIQIQLHARKGLRYCVIAVYELCGSDFALTRWLAINGPELQPVIVALMDAYELLENFEQAGTNEVTFPHTILSLPRKEGSRELRVQVEDWEGKHSVKLRVFQKNGDAWSWAEEWAWLMKHDLVEILPVLESADRRIREAQA